MGLFKFVKDAGASIFGGGDKPAEPPTRSFANHLRDHGIDPSAYQFNLSQGQLTVEGTAPDRDTREKFITILGNVLGVETVDDRLVLASAAGGPATAPGAPAQAATQGAEATPGDWQADTYTVQPGDTLGGIAKKLYGNASKYMVIFNANTPMLKDPNKIYPGQVLRIPPQS